MKDILSIRLNDQDKKMIQEIKLYLEDQYKDLDAFCITVTDTYVLKYAIYKTSKILKNEQKFLKNYNKKTD